VVVKASDDTEHWKDSADKETWQYWKFVWRSSLTNLVTLVDHLFSTHYMLAMSLAKAEREAFPATHPLRRFLTMFTYASIQLAQSAYSFLASSQHTLQRSVEFADWKQVTVIGQAIVLNPAELLRPFRDEATFNAMEPEMQKAAFYADGKLVMGALNAFVTDFLNVYEAEWKGADDTVVDSHIVNLLTLFGAHSGLDTDSFYSSLGVYDQEKRVTWSGLTNFLQVCISAVTAFHFQVGRLSDLNVDH